jgi:tripartite-type tricarboxylate transporter receptor subunit TctC
MRRRIVAAALASVASLALSSSWAQTAAASASGHPLRIIVPYAAGGSSDTLARIIAPPLSTRLGVPVIVENRIGATGSIGAQYVSRSAPDGSTLLITDVGGLAINDSLYSNLQFSVPGDFAPVAMVGYAPHSLVASRAFPANTLDELIDYARKNPDKVNFAAASGIGGAPQLAGVLFAEQAGIRWTYVPYKGGSQAITDLAGNQVDVSMIGLTNTSPFIKAGTLKVLGVSSKTRAPSLPEVPAIAEKLPGFFTGTFQGILAAKGTPPAIAERLNAEINTVLQMPDIRQKFEELGMQTMSQTPQQFTSWLGEQVALWKEVIKRNGVKVE